MMSMRLVLGKRNIHEFTESPNNFCFKSSKLDVDEKDTTSEVCGNSKKFNFLRKQLPESRIIEENSPLFSPKFREKRIRRRPAASSTDAERKKTEQRAGEAGENAPSACICMCVCLAVCRIWVSDLGPRRG
ncbi:hypothetical protein TSAR_010901 [Trichomalopsis sarcophagae]|uniref:Uncharacterized protein n=1 Tax=Trichomalopsis sarcophagae TaxID=543379 RepID=A0A232EYA2_9HYME|nr:hypothetical protein TSAR_010901 [Trichomalopsis sarcophagae]